jgi:hypothetical protein
MFFRTLALPEHCLIGSRFCHSADTGDGRGSCRCARVFHFRGAAAAFRAPPTVYERASVPARFPPSTIRYSSRIGQQSKQHSRISRGRQRTVPGPLASSPPRTGSWRRGSSPARGDPSAATAEARRPPRTPRFLYDCCLTAFASRPLSLTFSKRLGWTLHRPASGGARQNSCNSASGSN